MPGVELYFMQSSGGLAQAHAFQGKDAILSGPAGGIVGMVRTAELGLRSADEGPGRAPGPQPGPGGATEERHAVIGFDMGGTSTDVTHYAGEFERAFETQVAGVRVRAPMMAIHTVAAGGGSILAFDGARFRVGPQSAGANPGPACYRRGGPLTVTDANVMVGKIQPAFFPHVFGPGGDEALDGDVVAARFAALAATIARATGNARARGSRRGLHRHRRRRDGQRDQEDLGRARLRRHALHPAVLRRRRRPARLPRRRRARHGARLRPSARRRALGLRHGPGRPDRDAPGRDRAAARRRGGARARSLDALAEEAVAELDAPGRGASALRRASARPPALRRHRLGARRAVRRRGRPAARLRGGLPAALRVPDARAAPDRRGGLGRGDRRRRRAGRGAARARRRRGAGRGDGADVQRRPLARRRARRARRRRGRGRRSPGRRSSSSATRPP